MKKIKSPLGLLLAATSLTTLVMTATTVCLWLKLAEIRRNSDILCVKSGPSEDYQTYHVKKGDDIVSLAIRFAMSPTEIRELNGLSSEEELNPGRILKFFKRDAPRSESKGTSALDDDRNRRPPDATRTESKGTVPVRREMKVKEIRFDGERTFSVTLSEKPDMNVAKHYVSVEPKLKTPLNTSLGWEYNWGLNRVEPALKITGEYDFQTNYVLRLHKGLPIEGSPADTNLVALAEDVRHHFRRKNLAPSVSFANDGRYLPPLGRRQIALSSMNVEAIHAEIASVPAANIVQFLALEEDVYRKIYTFGWRRDESVVEDLSVVRWEKTLAVSAPSNREARASLELVPPSGIASNGIFFVTLKGEIKGGARQGGVSCRVVCVSDLGLSVRKTKKGLYVWVTSLTKGTPVADAVVEVYSTANELVARGRSDANGWCACEKLSENEPFAVIVSTPSGDDRSFLALRASMERSSPEGGPDELYLESGELDAFVWTERGIYRHDEKILVHALLRNDQGVAPKSLPVVVTLSNPSDDVYLRRTLVSDEQGVVSCDDFTVPADQPSGVWTLHVSTPGRKGGALLGAPRKIKVEEFAPPQIRVKALAESNVAPQDFAFTVSAEHLYGGPAKNLVCDGAVVFEDAAFAPAGWAGWRFGDATRALVPNHRRLAKSRLGTNGNCRLSAPLWKDHGRPAAAIRVTAQGTVFEDGGRPATTRATAILHYYPYYIGTTLAPWMRRPVVGRVQIAVACVRPDGTRLPEARVLTAKLERIDSVYSYQVDRSRGHATWRCDRIRTVVAEKLPIATRPDGNAEFEIPADACGDYALTISDAASDASFGMEFYLSDWGDEAVRAPLSNPSRIALTAEKPFYCPGEAPKIRVRAPFAGTALLSVFRDDFVYSEVLALTNATTEIALRAIKPEHAPNLKISLSVLQGVAGSARHLATKAHGELVLPVRRRENEIAVGVRASVERHRLQADVTAPGATHALVTVVDEGINLLTNEPAPDPVGFLFRPRRTETSLYDLYNRILPVSDDDVLRANGAKTGGGAGAELLDRVSLVATRRFKPLALWRQRIPVVDGRARVDLTLPEFIGEVRVTAIAYSDRATGAGAVCCKVSPKLIAQPDAPRFVAPGDTFEVTLPLANRSEGDGEVAYAVDATAPDGTKTSLAGGKIRLAKDESTVLRFSATAPKVPGQFVLRYRTEGFGETHETTIELPVRPAVAWAEKSGIVALEPGETFTIPRAADGAPEKFRYHVSSSAMAELKSAYEWLADYPHGCLEQTCSRVFPLIAAGGVLNALGSSDAAARRADVVVAGVRRVESMVRKTDFVMWPDCTYAPWDPEVSLYAAHFLLEAEKAGVKPGASTRDRVMGFLSKWALSTNENVSAYACHTLALAGSPEKDRMYRLYDARASLDLLSRARLARAFMLVSDRPRAAELLANADSPASIREAAFALLALLELDPQDARIDGLVHYLASKRDASLFAWGTTSENAHALLALGEYWRRRPVSTCRPEIREADGNLVNAGDGTAFVQWKHLTLPPFDEKTEEAKGLRLSRTFLTAEGKPYDLSKAACGDLVIVRLGISSDVARTVNDLVIEDPFPGTFEPVLTPLAPSLYPWIPSGAHAWVMRSDARDDRMLAFSKKFKLEKNDEVFFHYPVRVVSAGAFVLPGAAVEGMYQPSLRARTRGARLVVRH